jgi:OmpA-OmpF porin, OOP family
MKKALLAAAALLASAVSLNAFAQAGQAYWSGTGGVWKSGAGNCWRSGFWTPAMATSECDPDLAPKPASIPAPPPPVAPAPAPAPAPVAKPAAPKPAPTFAVTLTDTFASNSAVVTPAMRAAIDKQIIERMNSHFAEVTLVHVEGHTDRLGSHQLNQRLSERRANAVAAYLVSKGVDRNKIETLGSGKTNAVKACPDSKDRKALNECLAPNRRVIIEVRGKPR